MRSFGFLFALLVVAQEDAPVDDELESEKDETYSIMKEVEITMVSQIIDGNTFLIKDKQNKPITIVVGGITNGDSDKLSALLQRSMILYRPFPDEQQPGGDKVHADVWTAEGLHIAQAMIKKGSTSSGVTTSYTRDILQVAAEQEKQKSYKELEEALAEQGKFERDAQQELIDEQTLIDAKKKDWLLIGCILMCLGMFAAPAFVNKKGKDPRVLAKAAAVKAAADAKGKEPAAGAAARAQSEASREAFLKKVEAQKGD